MHVADAGYHTILYSEGGSSCRGWRVNLKDALRRQKSTTEYARTKDILCVQQLLGHRSLKTTLKYIQLVDMPQEERFISKVAMNVKEATELIELGFEYVTGEYSDGGKIFRKRKTTYLGS